MARGSVRSSVGLQVAEGGLGPVAEGDRLLDLERHGDPAVVGAVAVFLRHQIEEARQLLSTPGLLGGGERGGREAVEYASNVADRVTEGGAAAVGGRRPLQRRRPHGLR